MTTTINATSGTDAGELPLCAALLNRLRSSLISQLHHIILAYLCYFISFYFILLHLNLIHPTSTVKGYVYSYQSELGLHNTEMKTVQDVNYNTASVTVRRRQFRM